MRLCLRRREFIAGLGGTAVWPLAAPAQQQAAPVIGWLSSRTAATDALVLPVFHRALSAQGFIEGRNVAVEHRYTDSQNDRLPALVADLVGRRVAVMVAVGDATPTIRAVRAASGWPFLQTLNSTANREWQIYRTQRGCSGCSLGPFMPALTAKLTRYLRP